MPAFSSSKLSEEERQDKVKVAMHNSKNRQNVLMDKPQFWAVGWKATEKMQRLGGECK
jgi:hypothetical protein